METLILATRRKPMCKPLESHAAQNHIGFLPDGRENSDVVSDKLENLPAPFRPAPEPKKLKNVSRKVDRHGKVRWYFVNKGRYWPLPCDPALDRSGYDAIVNMIASGYVPPRKLSPREKMKPENLFTREIERAILRAKGRARKWKRDFDLDEFWVRDKIAEQRCRCILTDIPFVPTRIPGERNAFAPSIDRIDSSRGYTKDNVRIVLLSVNLALCDWGTEHFRRICYAFVNKAGRKTQPAPSSEGERN